MCFGRRFLRSTRNRSGIMAGGSGDQSGGPTSLLMLCSSSPLGKLGESPHKADRRALAGVVSGKVARHSRLPGQEDQVELQPEDRGPSYRQAGEGERCREGRRRREAVVDQLGTVTMSPEAHGLAAQSAGPSEKEDEAVRVPGAEAPLCSVQRLWNSMTRWLRKSSGPFSAFFRSLLDQPPSTSGGSASPTWPMPVPYPKWFEPAVSKVAGEKGYRHMCKQKAVNFAVVTLSWLHLKRASAAPPELSLQTKLSRRQWAVVRRIEKILDEVAATDAVGPEQMGRTAAKVESLDSLLENLHGMATSSSTLEPGFLKVGVSTDAGRVVGHLKSGTRVVAKEVETHTLSVPTEPPEFRPGDRLPPHHHAVFEDPMKFASDPLASTAQSTPACF